MKTVKKPKAILTITDPLAAYFQSYWKGEKPLWGAFWLWGMGIGTLVGLLFSVLSMPLLAQFSMLFYTEELPIYAALNGYMLLLLFGFWMTFYTWHTVSVWRCAAHSKPLARISARAFVLLVTLTFWPIYLLTAFIRFF